MHGVVPSKKHHRRLTLVLFSLTNLMGGPVSCGTALTPYEDRPVTDLPGDDGGLQDPWAWPTEAPEPVATGSTAPIPVATGSPSSGTADVTWTADLLAPPGDWQPGGLCFTGTRAPGADTIPDRLLWQVAGGSQIEEVEILPDGRRVTIGTRYAMAMPRLPGGTGAGPLTADAEIVAAAPSGRLHAWMRETRAPLNLGNPIADGVQALTLTPDALWVSREGRVIPFRRDRLQPDLASPSYLVETRAIAGGHDGSLWMGLPDSRLVSIGPAGQVTDLKLEKRGEWRGLALDEDAGSVVCLYRDSLLIVNRDGMPIFSTQSGYFTDATSVCVLSEGSFLVSDAGSGRLVRFRVVNEGLQVIK